MKAGIWLIAVLCFPSIPAAAQVETYGVFSIAAAGSRTSSNEKTNDGIGGQVYGFGGFQFGIVGIHAGLGVIMLRELGSGDQQRWGGMLDFPLGAALKFDSRHNVLTVGVDVSGLIFNRRQLLLSPHIDYLFVKRGHPKGVFIRTMFDPKALNTSGQMQYIAIGFMLQTG
jgi:hypothetical protein